MQIHEPFSIHQIWSLNGTDSELRKAGEDDSLFGNNYTSLNGIIAHIYPIMTK